MASPRSTGCVSNTYRKLQRFCTGLGTVVLLVSAAEAAEITYGPPTNVLLKTMKAASPSGVHVPSIVITLMGTIEPGDADKLKKIIDKFPPENPCGNRVALVSLNSPGGSFKEAINIARLIHVRQLPTFIETGAQCLSACAVIFMAGTEQFCEGAEARSRAIEMPAKLGFHRPFLEEFKVDIRPEVLTDIGAEEIQTFFSDQFLLAYDVANELIQEMLAVDTEAWSTNLLMRMLTATRQQENGRFVYLTTVNEAIEWGVDVINLVSPSIENRVDRQKHAFWLCYNGALTIASAYAPFWPKVEDVDWLYDLLERNLERDGSREKDSNTFDIEMVVQDGSGCKVTFPEDQQKVMVEHLGATEVFYLNFFREIIYAYDPTSRLEDLPLRRIQRSALSNGSAGRCVVFRDGQKIDDEPCTRLDRTESDEGLVETFIRPSGSRTVLILNQTNISLNGQMASPRYIYGRGVDFCYLNTSSGNTFCYAAQ